MGTNKFVTLPSAPAGTSGAQSSIDLFSLVPTNGLADTITVICTGAFTGDISLQGSVDNINWSTICQFSQLNAIGGGLLEPQVVEDTAVRYVRMFIHGAISSTVTMSVAAEVNCDCIATSGNTGADWTLGLTRIYAIDGVNGDDSNLGYADPSSSSAADYATACQTAGTRALKTFAALAAIFPRYGNGRQVEIIVANGGVNTAFTYAGTIQDFLAGIEGYQTSVIRGTGTNTTAACTAFDGSTNDVIYQGAVTGTGMNVDGYNPTGVPTTSTVQCLKVGGGAPSFPAELAIPSGLRVRFDANTTTAALRNVCRHICKVSGGDTLVWTTALPATPTGSDVFYIEQGGWISGAFSIGANAVPRTTNFQISGAAFSSTGFSINMQVAFTFCQWVSTHTSTNDLACAFIQTLVHPTLGNIIVGGNRAQALQSSGSVLTLTNLVIINSSSFSSPRGITIGNGFASSGSQTTIITPLGNNVQIGGTSTIVGAPVRLVGATLFIGNNFGPQGGYLSIQQLEVNNSSISGGITVRSEGLVLDLGAQGTSSSSITGSGNNGAGIDFTEGKNNTVYINLNNPPTITGTLGDVRLHDGTIRTWAQIVNGGYGFVDSAGNKFVVGIQTSIQYTNPRTTRFKFSGVLTGGGAATFTYLADAGPAQTSNFTTPLGYGTTGGFQLLNFFINPLVNTMTNACTGRLFINGSAVGNSITIPAGSTTQISGGISTPATALSNGDKIDFRIDDPGADVGHTLVVSVTIEG